MTRLREIAGEWALEAGAESMVVVGEEVFV